MARPRPLSIFISNRTILTLASLLHFSFRLGLTQEAPEDDTGVHTAVPVVHRCSIASLFHPKRDNRGAVKNN